MVGSLPGEEDDEEEEEDRGGRELQFDSSEFDIEELRDQVFRRKTRTKSSQSDSLDRRKTKEVVDLLRKLLLD